MTLDWTPLDTRDKLIAHPDEIDGRLAADDVG